MLARVGRYLIHERIAGGGMATVHIARAVGPLGFSKTVAVKRLHPSFADDAELSLMLLDEARLSARVQHPYVVPTLDVVHEGADLLLVMEYVHGESLARLMKRAKELARPIDPRVAAAIAVHALHGLHAAHEATDESGAPLHLVHRDVSPQNIMVGADGIARVLDFGVAKALGRLQTTRDGQVKGKVAYMSPEQLRAQPVDRRTDVFATFIVLWEMLTGQRLFAEGDDGATLWKLMQGEIAPPTALRAELPAALDAVVLRGLARPLDERYATAREAAEALEATVPVASATAVAKWVVELAGPELETRKQRIAAIEREAVVDADAPIAPGEVTKPAAFETAPIAPAGRPVSGATAPTPEERRPRRALVIAMVSAAVGVAVAVAVFVSRSAASDRVPSSAASAMEVSAGEGPLTVAAPPTVVEVAPAPARTSAASATAPSAPPPTAPSAATATAPKAAVPTLPARDCRNPYTLDAMGRRRYRRECLDH